MEWSKLKSRERKAILIFAVAAFFGVYMKYVNEPVSKTVAGYKTKMKRSEAQLRDLKTKQPQDTELTIKIEALKEGEKKLSEQLEELESMVPSRFYASQLVGEVSRLAKDVKLESVKQWIAKEQNYSRIFLEAKFYSGYVDAVTYLASIESISPYIRLEEMEMLEPAGKTMELGGAPVKLVVSCLLSDAASVAALKKVSEPPKLNIKRDILASSSKPTATTENSKFALEGITFNSENSTAIINGDVFRVNSTLGGYKITKILESSVVLSNGAEDRILSLATVAEKTK